MRNSPVSRSRPGTSNRTRICECSKIFERLGHKGCNEPVENAVKVGGLWLDHACKVRLIEFGKRQAVAHTNTASEDIREAMRNSRGDKRRGDDNVWQGGELDSFHDMLEMPEV